MNTKEGYSKKSLTNNRVLLAGGGDMELNGFYERDLSGYETPMISKTFTDSSFYGNGANYASTDFLFGRLVPKDYYTPWRIRLKITTTCPNLSTSSAIAWVKANAYNKGDFVIYSSKYYVARSNVPANKAITSTTYWFATSVFEGLKSTSWIEWYGRGNSYTYHNFNEYYNHCHYYGVLHFPSSAAIVESVNPGVALGVSIYGSNNYYNPKFPRTFKVDFYECDDCTFTMFDTMVKYSDYGAQVFGDAYKGTHNANTAYSVGNIVYSTASIELGRLYRCKAALAQNANKAVTDTAYWEIILSDASHPNMVDRGLQESGDANTNTYAYYVSSYYERLYAGVNGLKNVSIVMPDANNRLTSFTTTSGTGVSKTIATNGFLLTKNLFYYHGSDLDAGSPITTNEVLYSIRHLVDLRYTLNGVANNSSTTRGLEPFKPVYIVGVLHTDGLFYIRDPKKTESETANVKYWTQDEPTEEDGKIYIKLVNSVYLDNTTTTAAAYIAWNGATNYRGAHFVLSDVEIYWYHNDKFRVFDLADYYASNYLSSSYQSLLDYYASTIYSATPEGSNFSAGTGTYTSDGKSISLNITFTLKDIKYKGAAIDNTKATVKISSNSDMSSATDMTWNASTKKFESVQAISKATTSNESENPYSNTYTRYMQVTYDDIKSATFPKTISKYYPVKYGISTTNSLTSAEGAQTLYDNLGKSTTATYNSSTVCVSVTVHDIDLGNGSTLYWWFATPGNWSSMYNVTTNESAGASKIGTYKINIGTSTNKIFMDYNFWKTNSLAATQSQTWQIGK